MSADKLQKALQAVEKHAGTDIDRWKEWVSINTYTYNLKGLNDFREVLKKGFAPLGADMESVAVPAEECVDSSGRPYVKALGDCLVFNKRPGAKKRVLLVCHMDTVFPEDHPFSGVLKEEEDRLIAPGAADAKGGILVMLSALRAYEEYLACNELGWTVVVNADEEIGSAGSGAFLSELATQFDIGLVYEPSLPDGSLVSHRKGSGNFTLIAKGVAAHAGRDFNQGRNALTACSEALCRIEALSGKREGMTVNVGRFQSGGPLNVVPDKATAGFNIRIADKKDAEYALHRIEEILSDVQGQRGVALDLHGGFSALPKIPDERMRDLMSEIEKISDGLGYPVHWKHTGGVCDGNRLAAAGLPNVDTLGVYGSGIHQTGEWADKKSLIHRSKLTVKLLNEIKSKEL